MENLIRSIIFIGAILVLVVMFLPNRPDVGQILEFVMPFIIPLIIFSVFILQITTKIKKQGGNWKETIKAEIKKIENQSQNKKQ